jgi:hypothetical protein
MSDIKKKNKLKIENIEIMLTTNSSKDVVPLTRSMIYIPVKKDENRDKNIDEDDDKQLSSELPYICLNARIPYDVLKSKKQKEAVDILFNEKKFKSLMQSASIETNESFHNNLLSINAMTILKIIFTNSYPFTNDIISSYDHIQGAAIIDVDLNEQKRNSYIKMNGNTYTVTRAIWLNDVLNHPLYSDLIDKMNSYIIWAEKIGDKISSDSKNELETISDNIFNQYKNALVYNPTTIEKNQTFFNEKNFKKQKEILTKLITDKNRYGKRDSTKERELQLQITENLNIMIDSFNKIDSGIINIFSNNYNYNKKKDADNELTQEELTDKLNKSDENTKKDLLKGIMEIVSNHKDLKKIISIIDEVKNIDYIKNSLLQIKKYTEGSTYLFKKYIYKNDIPIIDVKAEELTSKNPEFKIYDDTKELIQKFCTPSIDLKGGIVSRNKYIQKNMQYVEDDTSIQKLIENYIRISRNDSTEPNKPVKVKEDKESVDPGNFIDFVKTVAILKGEKERKTTSKNLELGVNEQNFRIQGKPSFQIYVKLNLLQGELDEKNIKQIQCKFKDLFLDAKFKKIFYNKPKGWIPHENPFVAIEDLKDPNDPKAPKEKKDVKKVKKQGGNKTRRNYKKKYRLSNKRKV